MSIREVGERLDGSDYNDVGLAGFLKDNREIGRGIGAELIEDDQKRWVRLGVGSAQDF